MTVSFCCLKHLPEEEAAEQQSELRPISPDPPGPSIPIALHACYGALSTPRGGCNLLRPLPFYLHCSSHTAVRGQAKPTCASGPLPRPSSPGVLVSLTHSRSPSSAPHVQQGCKTPLKEQSLLTPFLPVTDSITGPVRILALLPAVRPPLLFWTRDKKAEEFPLGEGFCAL